MTLPSSLITLLKKNHLTLKLDEFFSVLLFKGPDTFSFLNNLSTKLLEKNQKQGQANLILDRLAKIRFYFWNYPLNNSLLILIEKEKRDEFIKFIEKNIFSENIEIINLDHFNIYANFGKGLEKILTKNTLTLPPKNSAEVKGDIYLINTHFTFYSDMLIMTPQNLFLKTLLKEFPVNRIFQHLSFEKSKWFPVKNLLEKTSILETHLLHTSVSFKKGCYPGQEIVARFISRNRVAPKKIMFLKISLEKKDLSLNNLKIISPEIVQLLKIDYSPTFKKHLILAVININHWDKKKTSYLLYQEKKLPIEILSPPLTLKKALPPKLIQELYHSALDEFHRNNLSQAQINFSKILENSPEHEEALEGIAICEEKLKNYSAAIKIHQKLIRINPQLIMPHTNLSRLYMLQGFIEKAEEESKKATILQFKNTAKEVVKSQENQEEEKGQRQIDFFKNILEQEPQDDIALYQLGKIYFEKKQYSKSIDYLKKTLLVKNDYSLVYLYLAKNYLELNKREEAQKNIQKGILIAEKNGEFTPLKALKNLLN